MEYDGIGEHYQNLTKYARGSLPRHRLDWSTQPSLQKEYPDAIKTVELPPPTCEGGPPLWETIQKRRSKRAYKGDPITAEQLSQLLWSTQGTTQQVHQHQF